MAEAAAPADKAAGVAPVLRFLVAGSINTLLSIAVYQAALFFTGHVAAYLAAYAAGIAFAGYAYARYVFHARLSVRRFTLFALFYLVSGGVGTLLNAGLIEFAGLHARIAIFVTVAIMLPLNYLGSRWCLQGRLEDSK